MKITTRKLASVSAFALLAMAAHATLADTGEGHKPKAGGKPNGAAALPWAEGEVESVDLENKWVILKHGPIRNLNMDAMTMAFAVKDPAMLNNLKAGDKIRFTAQNVGDNATIMSLKTGR